MDTYKILEAIGEGSFGRVFRGHSLKTGETVALKFIPKRNKVDRELRSLRRECEIQKELFHPNIVRMVDSFETEREVVAVSEYVPIQLYSLLEKYGVLPEDRVRSIACSLISAIYYLHSLRILHRDIKPQNILLTTDGEAKLCDFGFSRKMGINTYVLTSIKGTPLYMAPELINESPYDHTADLWSLGCILFELLTGKPPFCTNSIVQLIRMVHLDSIKWPNNISEECHSFLNGLLQKEPSHRLTWPSLLVHPWVEDGVVVLANPQHPSALTYPLSSSQEQIKELQKKQLIQQATTQPKILRNLSFFSSKVPKQMDVNQDVKPSNLELDCITSNPHKFLTAEIKNDPHINEFNAIEMKPITIDPAVEPVIKNLSLSPGVNVREAIGSSVRKLSSVSQESGFKAEDVEDITSRTAEREQRKDSMVNYLPSSVDASCISGRPSFPLLDFGALNTNLSNINEESVGNMSTNKNGSLFDNVSSNTIESEEWIRFIDKTLAEAFNDNFDIYKEYSELALFISPLQNVTCPSEVTERISTLLQLPFILQGDNKELMNTLISVYLRCKVVPNLVYVCKLIVNNKLTVNSSFTNIECDKETITTLKCVLTLMCFLLYTNNSFVKQFCDAVCIFSCYRSIEILLRCNIHQEISAKVLAILSQLLRQSFENSPIIDQIMPVRPDICAVLDQLINHPSSAVRACACTFIGYSAAASCAYVSCLENQHQVLCDLINMENEQVVDVQRAASFAVSCIQVSTNLIREADA